MIFWIAAALLTAVCITLIVAALGTPPDDATPDVEVYRDQMAELDRDAARGVLPAEDAATARAEVARRLLAADRAARAPRAGWRGSAALGAAMVAVIVAGVAGVTYWRIGAPGYGDLPLAVRIAEVEARRAARPGQVVAEGEVPDSIDTSRADVTDMARQLRDVLADRPDDLRGWRLAVQTESGLGDLEAAWRAQARVVALLGGDATGDDQALLAELMILAADGYISPEAETALADALRIDAGNGTARYYVGLMYAQGGRPDLAWPIWRRLIGDSPADAPWLEPIYAQIVAVSSEAGDPTPLDQLPRPLGGPSAEDIEAAGDMTLEERMDMIGGMVEGLAARLASDGGPPADWSRLIVAYGVLGRLDAAAAVYAEAKQVFAADRGALDVLAGAADRAGMTP